MKFDFLSQAAKFLQERKEYKRWLAAFMCLALAVTFGTVGALKMYGQAMTHQVKVLECQYEVHEHTEDCYEKNEDGEPTGDPVCGYADYVIHVHNDDCYDENQNLVCPLEEIEKHEHDDDCYEKKEVLVCEENESESADGHTHTEACYTEVKGELICEVSDDGGHTHDDGCYSETLVCDQEEHRHDDSCYKKELVCDNEEEDHEHDDGCYDETLDCDKDEHEHGGDCYSKELTCTEEEGSGHEHTDDCYKTEKELTCEEGESESADGHTHDDDCYETEEVLTCGKLELHTHKEALVEDGGCYDESAFDEDGQFIEGSRPVCGIPQLEEHVHTAECFKTVELTGEEVAQLNAGGRLHVHEDSCYDENGNLICEIPSVHVHGLDCYDEDGNLICGSGWAHTHDESCYDADGNLICGQEETHVHNKDCYDENGNLICGEQEEDHEHDANCYDADGRLTCGYEDAKDHEHDANCYDKDGNLICGYEGVKDHEHSADCYDIKGNLICSYEGMEDHVHSETCYDADGNLICGYEILAVYENSKIFECEDYVVVARYNEDAHIPAEAELLAEKITPETDEEHYARREAEYQETLGDETASMRALLKIGFYLDGEEDGGKTEIEPETPVEISIQFLDEDGLPEGSPITVVHFADEGTEKLDGSKAKNSSTTFEMKSFSEIAIGYISEEEQKELTQAVDGTMRLHLADSFEYEDDAFQITFHVEGEAILPENTIYRISDFEKGNDAADSSTEAEDTEQKDMEDQSVEQEASQGDEDSEDNKVPDSSDIEADSTTLDNDNTETPKLRFKVEQADKGSAEYQAFKEHAEEIDGAEELYRLQVMTYSLTYGEEELDLSRCKITAEICPAQALEKQMEKSISDAAAFLLDSEGKVVQNETEVIPESAPYLSESDETEKTEGTDEETDLKSDEQEGESEDTIEEKEKPDLESEFDLESTPNSEENEENPENESDSANITDMQEDSGSKGTAAIDDPAEYYEDTGEYVPTEITFSVSLMSDDKPVDRATRDYDGSGAEPMMVNLTSVDFFATRASGQPNPKFTVQYYANLDILNKTGSNALPVIDTSGKKLPKNGKGTSASPNDNAIKNIYVDNSGKVLTTKTVTEVYKNRSFEYHKAPTINYINALVKNPNYKLKEVWVLIPGRNAASIKKEDWNVYTYSNNLHFTNRSVSGTAKPGDNSGYVLIKDGAILRLVYDTTGATPDFEAAFYDYDITSGRMYKNVANAISNSNSGITQTGSQQNGTLYYTYTKQAGINSAGNYSGSGTKLAFGNVNTGTTMGENLWNGNLLNKYNGTQDGHPTVAGSYKGCTFGLVTGLSNGKIQYAKSVQAPQLFNEGSATGKTSYDENQYSLKFNRAGDTYTLTAVNGTGATGLESFGHPSPYSGLTHTHIWTNDFWPMDSAGSYGTNKHDLKFGSYQYRGNRAYAGSSTKGEPGSTADSKKTYPYSDDGKDHNSYFGMQYSVEFELSEDYVGPLEYYFFGDDDMWVFLDNKLVCDIGGVHSSVGEYVNLWDYLKKGSKGKHTLSFFYTERGASGSTCWMQFTLPSVSSLTPETTDEDYGHLRIEKTVTQNNNGNETVVDNNDEFTFTINFTDKKGNKLPDDYSYVKYDKDGKEIGSDLIIWDGGEFTLKNGEYIIVQYLPQGTKYKVTETNGAITIIDNVSETSKVEYFTDITIAGTMPDDKKDLTNNKVAEGSIPKSDTTEVKYNNKFYVYGLPETGGSGITLYTMAGVVVILFGAGFLYRKKFRERRV